MPESFLGDGLIVEDSLPVAWSPGPLPDGAALARLNADNHQLLSAEASFDEVRVHDALKDESSALVHELQRLEFKLNVLLRLTGELAVRNSALPQPRRVRLSSHGLEWFGAGGSSIGDTGLLSVYVNSALPQALKVPATLASDRAADDQRVAQFLFTGLSEATLDLLEKLIFRRHRRMVAGARLPPS